MCAVHTVLCSYLVSVLAQEPQQRSRRNHLKASEVAAPAPPEHTPVARAEVINAGVQCSGDDRRIGTEAGIDPTLRLVIRRAGYDLYRSVYQKSIEIAGEMRRLVVDVSRELLQHVYGDYKLYR